MFSPLHEAVKMRTSIAEINRLAKAACMAETLDAVNARYLTALHMAVVVHSPDVVSLLISLGASIGRQERLHGDTVLHLACRLGFTGCANAIFDVWKRRTAEPDIRTILQSVNYEGTRRIKLMSYTDLRLQYTVS